ncbi:MAG: hypothetical protein H6Q14_224 [Bacteroidetes bacterium]|jgi:hypothetical protein|nr:hypothetical protein [Bacteroidota bacterium]
MSQIKKILLYLIGVGLLIFGNRDVLAKISTKKVESAEKELKPDLKAFSKPKDSVRREAIKVVEKKNDALLDSIHAATTAKVSQKAKAKELKKAEQKKKKSEVVVAGVQNEAEKVEEAPKTKVEKEEPEKAHGTE